MLCWLVGTRTRECAYDFMDDLASRLVVCVQLTTDGLRVYPEAVEHAFKGNVDYGMLNKSYADEGLKESKRRYSPATMTSSEKLKVYGNPDADHIGTSHVERANLSMRMGMRRFTRLHPHFGEFLAILTEKDIHPRLITNGNQLLA